MSTTPVAKAGTLLYAESGEYSDRRMHGIFRVLVDFSPLDELERQLVADPEQREDYSFCDAEYLASLVARGLIEDVTYGTLYLGAYHDVETFRFTPDAEQPSTD